MKVVSRIIDKKTGYEDVVEYPFTSHSKAKRFIEKSSVWLKSIGYSRYEKDGKTVFVSPDGLTVEYELII